MSVWLSLVMFVALDPGPAGPSAERLDRSCLRTMMAPSPVAAAAHADERRWFVIASNGMENPYAACARSFAAITELREERRS